MKQNFKLKVKIARHAECTHHKATTKMSVKGKKMNQSFLNHFIREVLNCIFLRFHDLRA